MKKYLGLFFILAAEICFSKTILISAPEELSSKCLAKGDSILFKRGQIYYTHINLFIDSPDDLYFGAYGDTLLPKPVLDGCICHFDFDAQSWSDYEDIGGVRFYKKYVKGLKDAENVYADGKSLILAREPDQNETVITGQRNPFTGFFKIDSVDTGEPRKVFYDFRNQIDWTGAEIITRTQQWSYEIRKIKNCSEDRFELEESMREPLKKNWGYFLQRHYSALDSEGEWFFDEVNRILYFAPLNDLCVIYISGNADDNNSGFDLRRKNRIRIENIAFENYKHGILLEHAKDISVTGCEFTNCVYGVINKRTYLEKITVENCTFTNMKSYGIRLIANNSLINKNVIDSVGLSMGSESREMINLNGIEVYGSGSIISGNIVRNIGYCGIRIYNCPEAKVTDNIIENTGLVMSDCGGIYTWHAMEGNKLINRNTIKNVLGNMSGTDQAPDNSFGIYLDELSLHFRVDSNYVTGAGNGIYLQNSRSDTIRFNYTEKNRKGEFHINHGGNILNGGRLNPENDPEFDPDRLDSIPKDYVWDREEGLLYHKEKHTGVVYVKPGNNFIGNNIFIPDTVKNSYSIQFRTWQNIDKGTIERLTGNSNFFYNNIPDRLVAKTGLYIQGSNVKDYYFNGKEFDVVKYKIGPEDFSFLRQFLTWTGRGNKPVIEK
ncbi:MAG TPA: right-handed parallel beta-helix repeat-containing protein [Clostridiales bacterium]|nr:right-handed parallel beta-helix repeat-containing protein [Clostridiales bacterium]